MLSLRLLVPFFAIGAFAFATPSVRAREDTLAITSLEKNVTATSGTGNVAAAGQLSPFGSIGIGNFGLLQLLHSTDKHR